MNHIKNFSSTEENRSWCGAKLDHNFYFKDLEQVIINNNFGERVPCQECVHGVVVELAKAPDSLQLTTGAQSGIIQI